MMRRGVVFIWFMSMVLGLAIMPGQVRANNAGGYYNMADIAKQKREAEAALQAEMAELAEVRKQNHYKAVTSVTDCHKALKKAGLYYSRPYQACLKNPDLLKYKEQDETSDKPKEGQADE